MNRLSPVSSRLPAPSSAPMKPEPCCFALPSPKIVSILMPGVMNIIAAGLGHRALARVEHHLDELHLVAVDLELDLVRLPRRNRRGCGRRRRAAAQPGGQLGDVLDRRPVAHAAREHQRVPVSGSRLDLPDDLLLADGSDLLPAEGHVPLLIRHRVLHRYHHAPRVSEPARERRVRTGSTQGATCEVCRAEPGATNRATTAASSAGGDIVTSRFRNLPAASSSARAAGSRTCPRAPR